MKLRHMLWFSLFFVDFPLTKNEAAPYSALADRYMVQRSMDVIV